MPSFSSAIGSFVIGESPIGGSAPTPPTPSAPTTSFPPTGPTTTQNIIPAYLYWEYNDDPDLTAMLAVYTQYAQAYLTYLNNLNLPVYTQGNIVGGLLDWVAEGIYGMIRPTGTQSGGTAALGPFNTAQYNTLQFDGSVPGMSPTLYNTTDDAFKRILTWHFNKGQGKAFTIRWLKNRIFWFLYGVNGTLPAVTNTYGISVQTNAQYSWTITLATTQMSQIFKQAVAAGFLKLPPQIAWTVTLI